MNGIDPILDREYAQQLAEQAAEKERERLDKLPKSWVMGLDGPEYKHVRPTPKYDSPVTTRDWPETFEQKAKRNFLDGMVMPRGIQQDIPLEMMYTKEELETGVRKSESKKYLSLSDFDSYIRKSYF